MSMIRSPCITGTASAPPSASFGISEAAGVVATTVGRLVFVGSGERRDLVLYQLTRLAVLERDIQQATRVFAPRTATLAFKQSV